MTKGRIKVVLQDNSLIKEKNSVRMRAQRASWTQEQKAKNREDSKIRMRKMRAKRKKEKEESTRTLKATPRTRQQIEKEELRLKVQREKKRIYRSNLHPQKKRRIREKDRLSKRQKRENLRKQIPTDECAEQVVPSTSMQELTLCNTSVSLSFLRNHINSMKGRKPDQKKFKKTYINNLAKKITEKYGQEHLHKIFGKVGVRKRYLESVGLKKRKDTLAFEVTESVRESYFSEVNAVNVPNVKVINKEGKNKFVLQKSLYEVYLNWKEENPGKKLSFSKFAFMKPKNVQVQKKRHLLQCLCEYCENVRLKIEAVNKVLKKQNLLQLGNIYKTVDETLCPKQEDFHALACIQRSCLNCGTDVLRQRLDPLLTGLAGETEAEWSKWDNVKTRNPKTGRELTKRQIVIKRGLPHFLVFELLEEIEVIAEHLFTAKWQQVQFSKISKAVPSGCVILTADFAENYTCFQQNEIQGAHWAKDAVTIHPFVVHYNCKDCPGDIVEDMVDIISDDLMHDSHAVHKFLEVVFEHLQIERGIEIQKVFLFSDGCAAQYKSKLCFMDISMAKDDFGFVIERGYYGARHGKNRCDGEGGVLKNRAARAVKNGEAIIIDAQSMYQFCQKVLEKPKVVNGKCNHKRRSILYVNSQDIKHDRPERACKTVPGTRKFHSVLGIKRGVIKTRSLSCYCEGCCHNNESECINKAHVGDWKTVNIKSLSYDEKQAGQEIEETSNQKNATDQHTSEEMVVQSQHSDELSFISIDSNFDALELSFSDISFENQNGMDELFKKLESTIRCDDIIPIEDCRNALSASTGTPPASTGTPPASTGTPPASTGTPPASTGTPPASTGTPPASTGAPPASTGTPPASTGTPPASTGTPPASTGTPPASTSTPPASTSTPPASTDTLQTRTDNQITSQKFSVGTHILTRHGSKLIPAVITRYEKENESLLWVQYFSEKKNQLYSQENKEFTVLEKDIVSSIDPPDIALAGGSRFLFKFSF